MTQIERITHFEELLYQIAAVTAGLHLALEEFRAIQPLVKELDAYYSGPDWRRDFEDDEAGKLPVGLKRGILSEDAAFNALEDNRRLLSIIRATPPTGDNET